MRSVMKQALRVKRIAAVVAGLGLFAGAGHAVAQESDNDWFSYSLGGYLRGWASLNLQDQPEFKTGHAIDSRISSSTAGKLSMLRGSLKLDLDVRTGPVKWKAIGRVDREIKTDYLTDLERLRATNGTTGGDDKSILDNYNAIDLREIWAEVPIGDRMTVKIGKQQLVWGESDFFHAMDVVNGYDLSWRLFFEGDNEEWRKPLMLVSTKIRVPEANGMLAAYVRPGLDRCQDIGTTFDIKGGRWFVQPYRGYDLSAITNKDCHHPEGNENDVTYGVRWSGEALDLSYSFAYLKTFAADPVANSAFVPYGGKAPTGPVFDLIHPKIDVFGMTVSGYSQTIDSVLTAEVAYTKDQPYNVGSGNNLTPGAGPIGLGLGGIKLKDTITTMLRVDKNLSFENLLGTTRPSFSSVQLFNTYIVNFDRDEDLVRLFAFGTPMTRNNAILTALTVLNYRNDTINPSFAVGFDLTHGGGFAIPAVGFTLSDKWTAKVEADLFWTRESNKEQFSNQRSNLFGYFGSASQFVVSVTRQF